MTRVDWKHWVGTDKHADENPILAFLRGVETVFAKMISGIWLFFWEQVPDFFRTAIEWIHSTLLLLVRIAVRLVRVSVVFYAWFLIVFFPVGFYTGIITAAWTVLALVGSFWGVRRYLKKRRALANPVEVTVVKA